MYNLHRKNMIVKGITKNLTLRDGDSPLHLLLVDCPLPACSRVTAVYSSTAGRRRQKALSLDGWRSIRIIKTQSRVALP